MTTILEILFLSYITVAIIGLLWALIREKPARPWAVRFMVSLLLFITVAALENNYLSSQKNTVLRQEQEPGRASPVLQQQLTRLEHTILSDKISEPYLKDAESAVKKQIDLLNAKIDYVMKHRLHIENPINNKELE